MGEKCIGFLREPVCAAIAFCPFRGWRFSLKAATTGCSAHAEYRPGLVPPLTMADCLRAAGYVVVEAANPP